MRISFDVDKHRRNTRERGFGFDYAALIFEGPTVEWQDLRRDYGEDRFVAIGENRWRRPRGGLHRSG